MKYGKVLTYKDFDEARKLIGKKVIGSDFIFIIEKYPNGRSITTLNDVTRDCIYPFKIDGNFYQFIREVIEESKSEIMTNRQLAKWLAKRNGEYTLINSDLVYTYYDYFKSKQNNPVPDNIRIRTWDSNEWIIPTVDIYERDCHS